MAAPSGIMAAPSLALPRFAGEGIRVAALERMRGFGHGCSSRKRAGSREGESRLPGARKEERECCPLLALAAAGGGPHCRCRF